MGPVAWKKKKSCKVLSEEGIEIRKTPVGCLELQTGVILRGKISGNLRGFWMDVMTPVIAAIVIFMQRLIRSLFKRLPVITLET
ncbi:hypothetical protein ACTQ5P_06175 [Bacillota bacterium LCP21S3_G6]